MPNKNALFAAQEEPKSMGINPVVNDIVVLIAARFFKTNQG